jgi:membrane-associated phospholipid phosphatase
MARTAPEHPSEEAQRNDARNGHQRGAQGGHADADPRALPVAAHETADQTAAQLRRAREPRWRALAKGRVYLAAYVSTLAAVIALGFAAHAVSILPGDIHFTRELQELRIPLVYGLLYAVSYIGYPLLSGVIVALVVAALLAARLSLAALFVPLSLLADVLGGLIKQVVGRHRPLPSQVNVVQVLHSPSFPSGHVLHYTVFYGFLAFVLAISFRPSWLRNALIGVCLALIVLVGPSRVYLGEHWLSDVVGGYLIGALLLVPLIAAYMWARERFARG